MSQFHFRPAEYLDLVHAEIPDFDELQEQVGAATEGIFVTRILELGTGTGETARRVLARHPQARLTGIDVSEEMLAVARRTLPPGQIDELAARGIEEPLPDGPFDLVVSALTVHHLDGSGKAELFRRSARALRAGGRFVLGDVVVPENPADAITPLTPGHDMPSPVDDLVDWLRQANLDPCVVWRVADLVVIRADRRVD
jgi:tRNA (cmo5U34)-methyltransferase